MQAWYLKIASPKIWIWMEAATVMRKNIKKLIMLLSMIMMNQLRIVLTNKHGFLLQPILMGFWMELKTVMKKNIKQLSLLWTLPSKSKSSVRLF